MNRKETFPDLVPPKRGLIRCSICLRSYPDIGGGVARTERSHPEDGVLAEVRDQLGARVLGIECLAEWDLGPEYRRNVGEINRGRLANGLHLVDACYPVPGIRSYIVVDHLVVKDGDIPADSLEVTTWRRVEVPQGQAAISGSVEAADPDAAPGIDPGDIRSVVSGPVECFRLVDPVQEVHKGLLENIGLLLRDADPGGKGVADLELHVPPDHSPVGDGDLPGLQAISCL